MYHSVRGDGDDYDNNYGTYYTNSMDSLYKQFPFCPPLRRKEYHDNSRSSKEKLRW